MTSCATCAIVLLPYVSALRLRPAEQDPQPRWSKVVELGRPGAYPPPESHPVPPVAFADRGVHPLLLQQRSVLGPAFQRNLLRWKPLLLIPRRYWTVWPGNLPMLQAKE